MDEQFAEERAAELTPSISDLMDDFEALYSAPFLGVNSGDVSVLGRYEGLRSQSPTLADWTLVILDPRTPAARDETRLLGGTLVQVHRRRPQTLLHDFLEASRRADPVLLEACADVGHVRAQGKATLRDLTELSTDARLMLDAGPPPSSPELLRRTQESLDLSLQRWAGAGDPVSAAVGAADVYVRSCETLLVTSGSWLAPPAALGRTMSARLGDLDSELTRSYVQAVAGSGDPAALRRIALLIRQYAEPRRATGRPENECSPLRTPRHSGDPALRDLGCLLEEARLADDPAALRVVGAQLLASAGRLRHFGRAAGDLVEVNRLLAAGAPETPGWYEKAHKAVGGALSRGEHIQRHGFATLWEVPPSAPAAGVFRATSRRAHASVDRHRARLLG